MCLRITQYLGITTEFHTYLEERMSLGEVIRRLRKDRELNQVQLAERIDTDSGNVSRYETDKQKPSMEMLEKIADALSTSVSEICRLAESSSGQLDVASDKYVMVPRLNLAVAAGNGTEPAHVEIQGALAFQREWLRKKGLNPDMLEIYDATGDSMSPYIENGDVLLVDVAATPPKNNEVWVLWQDAPLGVRVKRVLYRENGDLIIRSDNPDKAQYPDEIIPGHQGHTVKTVGKVVWRGG
jgi:phage repressor protein C with HTH and peptisase S24 domain